MAIINRIDIARVTQYASTYLGDLKTRRRTLNGEYYEYVEGGSRNKDTILMFHATLGSKMHFRTIMHGLSNEYRVIAMDLPGVCASNKYTTKLRSVSQFGDWVVDFMNSLKIDRAHIIGFSSGAGLACYLASMYRDRVLSLCTLGLPDMWNKNEIMELLGRRLQVYTLEDFNAAIKISYYIPPNAPDFYKRRLVEKNIENREKIEFLLKLFERSFGIILTHFYRISCPTLLIRGNQDPYSSMESHQKFQSIVPKAKVFSIDECGHIFPVEKPKETVNAYRDFLEDYYRVNPRDRLASAF